ncbi:MAG TPA: DUF1573 domain-containing protein [Bacteroidia bacterium]|nr:DUF1573 domain-containing protein [Bacteroidia bacterium]
MMKRFLILLIAFSSVAFRPVTLLQNMSVMKFDEVKYNFGFIHQGDIVTHNFTFTNTGEQPIIIEDAEVSCHCTTVDFPKQPIAKGQTGIIKVTYDSKSAIDRQERTVIIKSNASNAPVTLTFKCVVLKAKN